MDLCVIRPETVQGDSVIIIKLTDGTQMYIPIAKVLLDYSVIAFNIFVNKLEKQPVQDIFWMGCHENDFLNNFVLCFVKYY